jgi:hypothetical protein
MVRLILAAFAHLAVSVLTCQLSIMISHALPANRPPPLGYIESSPSLPRGCTGIA